MIRHRISGPATDRIKPSGGGLNMIWHIRTEDAVRLSAELANLDLRRHELNARIRAAINHERYSLDPAEMARAAEDRTHLVAELDRLMTRARAVEAKLLLLQKRADKAVPFQNRGAKDDSRERVTVEVHCNSEDARLLGDSNRP